ncbi:MAG: transposase [Planctomycetota bacterium]
MPSRLQRHNELYQIHFITFSCFRRLQFFRHDTVKLTFTNAMKRVRGRFNIRWIGYVIMPEHVHLLVAPQEKGSDEITSVSSFLNTLKGASGHDGKEALREVWRRNRSLGTRVLDAWATGMDPRPFWKPRGYDFNVVRDDTLLSKLDYTHNNPIRRGLAESAEQWRWSSFRYYELADDSLIEMDWDGRMPFEF